MEFGKDKPKRQKRERRRGRKVKAAVVSATTEGGEATSTSSSRARKGRGGRRRDGVKRLVLEREMEVPSRYMGLLIGRGGVNIQLIQDNSHCRIIVMPVEEETEETETTEEPTTSRSAEERPVGHRSRGDESAEDVKESEGRGGKPEFQKIRLIGSPEEIDACQKEVSFIIENGRMMLDCERGSRSAAPGEGRVVTERAEEMRVPTKVCGMLIGSEGERIKQIQLITGAEVFVKWDDTTTDSGKQHIEAGVSKVTLKGTSRAIREAKKEIRKVLALFGGAGGSGASEIQFEIPSTFTRDLIGKDGVTIRALQCDLSVTIQIKRPVHTYDSVSSQRVSIVQIVGEAMDIEIAKEEIEMLLGTFKKCGECHWLRKPEDGWLDSNGWKWYCERCWKQWGVEQRMDRLRLGVDDGDAAVDAFRRPPQRERMRAPPTHDLASAQRYEAAEPPAERSRREGRTRLVRVREDGEPAHLRRYDFKGY